MDMYCGNILVADLATGETEEIELEEDLVREGLGGSGINIKLYKKYEDSNPLIFGTGPLTGSMVPGGNLGVITGKSPVTGKVCHAPFTLFCGAEFKLSGFSFLVLKGKSNKPVYFWIHDGIADVEEGGDLWGKDTWATVDKIRAEKGDSLIQVLSIGPAGEKGSNLAQIVANYWSSGDCFGMGKLMGEKNVKAIALRGMGETEVANPEEFVEKSGALLGEMRKFFKGKKGIKEISAVLGGDDIGSWLKPMVHRYSTNFNCPMAWNTFVKYNESPQTLKQDGAAEPGFLLTGLSEVLEIKKTGMEAEAACRVLEKMARLGLEPTSAAALINKAGKKNLEDASAELEGMVSATEGGVAPWPINSEEARLEEKLGSYSTRVPPRPVFSDFGLSGEAKEVAKWWVKRNALAYVLGICPTFAMMSPQLTEEVLVDLVNQGMGFDLTVDDLNRIAAESLKNTVEGYDKESLELVEGIL